MDKTKILIIEDNPALAGVLKFNLDRAGYMTKVARSGNQACQLAVAETFDLVITDQQMPGMTGIEVITFLRKRPEYRCAPMIVLTAKSLELDKDELTRNLKVSKIIGKPFSPLAVVQEVEETLDRNSSSRDRERASSERNG